MISFNYNVNSNYNRGLLLLFNALVILFAHNKTRCYLPLITNYMSQVHKRLSNLKILIRLIMFRSLNSLCRD